jgi:hypothetical protein
MLVRRVDYSGADQHAMGKKQTWINKARGYFDVRPGKLAACPPEIRDNVSVLKPLGQNEQSLVAPSGTSSGIAAEAGRGHVRGNLWPTTRATSWATIRHPICDSARYCPSRTR